MREYGLGPPASWLVTGAFAICWLGLMLAYSPVADRIASRLAKKPPDLRAFRSIQQSTSRLVIGIIIAWLLGGFLEEFVFRGVVLQWIDLRLRTHAPAGVAAGAGVVAAALGAAMFHVYQGRRAMIIVGQLSVLFGVLFLAGGRNLWVCIICHGLYDTIAFIRFARGKSKYSKLNPEAASA